MRFFVIFLVAPLLVMALTTGCGKQPGKYGNFANIHSAGMVDDAVGVLKIAYPPAKTRLNLMHHYDGDVFGMSFVETLRREGYAIAEYAPPPRGDKHHTAATLSDPKPAGFDFGYVVDPLASDGGMRLSLFVGDETLSRLYSVGGMPDEPAYAPLGDWVHRQRGAP